MLVGLRKGNPEWLTDVLKAISILDAIPPISDETIKSLRQANLVRIMLDAEETGKPWGSPDGPNFITLYADNPSVKAESLESPQDQIRAFRRSIAYYFSTGSGISPILARNIANNVAKAKRTEVEYAFLRSFERHFGGKSGTVEIQLSSRLRELSAVHDRRFKRDPANGPVDRELSKFSHSI